MIKPQRMTLTDSVVVVVVVIAIAAIGFVAFRQLAMPAEARTQMQTDVETRDVIIKSERDLSTASGELDTIQLENEENEKMFDEMSDDF